MTHDPLKINCVKKCQDRYSSDYVDPSCECIFAEDVVRTVAFFRKILSCGHILGNVVNSSIVDFMQLMHRFKHSLESVMVRVCEFNILSQCFRQLLLYIINAK